MKQIRLPPPVRRMLLTRGYSPVSASAKHQSYSSRSSTLTFYADHVIELTEMTHNGVGVTLANKVTREVWNKPFGLLYYLDRIGAFGRRRPVRITTADRKSLLANIHLN